MNQGRTLRRKGALARLEAQLKAGNKQSSEGLVALTDSDSKRISREIEILKSRV